MTAFWRDVNGVTAAKGVMTEANDIKIIVSMMAWRGNQRDQLLNAWRRDGDIIEL